MMESKGGFCKLGSWKRMSKGYREGNVKENDRESKGSEREGGKNSDKKIVVVKLIILKNKKWEIHKKGKKKKPSYNKKFNQFG